MPQAAANTQHLTAGCAAQVEVRNSFEEVAQRATGPVAECLDCLNNNVDAGTGNAFGGQP